MSYQTITGGSTLHNVWNTLALLLVIITLWAVLRIPAGDYRNGWSSKAWWVAGAIGLTSFGVGIVIPLGSVILPFALMKARRSDRPSRPDRFRVAAVDWLWWVVIGAGLVGVLVLLIGSPRGYSSTVTPARPHGSWALALAAVDELINAGFAAWFIVGGIRVIVRRRLQRSKDPRPTDTLVWDSPRNVTDVLPRGYIDGPSRAE